MRRSLVVALVASVVAATVAVAAPAMAAVPTYQAARQITLPSTGAAGVAVDSARGLLYVASRDANAVWVYDEATLTLQATIAVPNQPYNLAVGPTGYVYVSQYTGNGLAGSVAAIDPTTRTVVDTNATGNSPFGVTVSQDGTRLWVGNDSSGFISVFDLTNPASPLPIAAIPLASTSERVTEGPNGLLYVTTNNSQVFVVNRATGATTTTWTGLASAHQVMISADGTHAFVSQDSGATAPIFDLATNAASGSIPVGATFYQSTDPSLGAGFITASSADALAVIDSTTGALLQTVPGVTGAYYTATDPATHRTFVTSLNGTTLTEVTPTAPVVTTNPTDQIVTAGDAATFTAAATSTPPLAVQWQQSTDNGASWADIPGATSDSYTTPPTGLSDSGHQFRAVFTNDFGSTTTTAATLTVNPPPPPVVTTNPVDQTVVEGAAATFTAAATSSVAETVQWQVSTDGGGSFSDVAGATSDTLTVPSTTLGQSGNQYRAEQRRPPQPR
jgi:DNA-binding beta-propeller fold protein YncE